MSETRVVHVVMPQMGESLSEGTIVKWLKRPGDRVEHDEPLFELSTDKVDTEVPAPAAGRLTRVLANEGDTIAVGETVAMIETASSLTSTANVGAVPPAASAVAEQPASAGASKEEPGGHFRSTHAPQLVSFRRGREGATSVPGPTSVPGSTAVPAVTSVPSRPTSVPGTLGARATSVPKQGASRSFSPAVLADAQRAGLSLGQLTGIAGSGREGRITKRDVQRFLESGQRDTGVSALPTRSVAGPSAGPPPEFVYRPADGDRLQPMSPVRKRIARHMRWSVRISPHASAQSEVDMSAVSSAMERRDAFREQFGAPLTFTVFAAAASVRALQKFPVLNSSVVGDQVVFKPSVNLGVAVALPETDDLIVPVVRRADELSLVGLARAIHDLAQRARARQLRPEDVHGGTFTLTNPGVFGGITGTPILNQPQVAILSMGAVRKQPVVVDDAVVVRPIMALALTFDHRAADGMVAFRYLARVRELLETLPGDWQVE
jgi:2-oxoglutarate dehydrogenase E2 component (dihydrolipoamide succinyltransferase)